jgi:hypothetical protein
VAAGAIKTKRSRLREPAFARNLVLTILSTSSSGLSKLAALYITAPASAGKMDGNQFTAVYGVGTPVPL